MFYFAIIITRLHTENCNNCPDIFILLSGEHHRRALDFGESSKWKELDNSLHLGSNLKTPRSPHQFLSSIAHDASLQIKTDEHDSSSGQMSDSELLSFAVGGSSMVEGRGSASGKKQKIGDVQVPDMLFKDSKARETVTKKNGRRC